MLHAEPEGKVERLVKEVSGWGKAVYMVESGDMEMIRLLLEKSKMV